MLGFRNVIVLNTKSQYIPEVVVVRRGASGVGERERGVGQLGGGFKQGQFTSNLRGGRAVLVTSGGSQVSGRGYKGELARGAKRMRHVNMWK